MTDSLSTFPEKEQRASALRHPAGKKAEGLMGTGVISWRRWLLLPGLRSSGRPIVLRTRNPHFRLVRPPARRMNPTGPECVLSSPSNRI